jgi:class 3 adenylate cyclase/CHASE2 domain-containing sensor protein
MTPFRRRLLVRTAAMGVGLTVLVIALDSAGALHVLERWLYDRRARDCQFFTPAPTDRLVHVDIDDVALKEVGNWPWPRDKLADIVDEARLAGASAMAMDILFDSPQPEHDEQFAAALRRFGKVVMPVSLKLARDSNSASPRPDLVKLLKGDLEMPRDGLPPEWAGAAAPSEDEFIIARREALSQRLAKELSHGRPSVEALRLRLLPHSGEPDANSSLAREFEDQYRLNEALAKMARLTYPASNNNPPLLDVTDENTTLVPAIADASLHGGYADYFRFEGDTVRSIPLWVNYRGRRLPQVDLALACAMLGVDPGSLLVGDDDIAIATPQGKTIIPTHSIESPGGGRVGGFFDIPWFGNRDWRTMYDFPRHRETRQHVPITLLWSLADSRKTIAHNNAQASEALKCFAEMGVTAAKNLLRAAPALDDVDARAAPMQEVLREAESLMGPAPGPPAMSTPMTEDEKALRRAYSALSHADRQNRRFAEKAAAMRAMLGGKALLIGWTATGMVDERPTSLHDTCPGVVIHGVVVNAIVTGHFWRKAPAWVTWLIIAAVGLFTIAIVASLPPWRALFCTLLLMSVYFVLNGIVLFDYGHTIVGAAGPLIVCGLSWSLLTLMRFVVERKERARITRRFRSYVDPSLVNYVLEHPEQTRFAGESREMTMAFSDLVGFTTLTEKLGEDTVPLLAEYLSLMVPPIRAHCGYVAKFMGDGIFFFFGAPTSELAHAAHAVAAVIAMRVALDGLNVSLGQRGLPQLGMRVGVSTGRVIIGDAGPADCSDYTALGDSVNFAARLETANKPLGTLTLVSARTVELLNGSFLVRPIANLRVVGKTQGVEVYEPLCRAEEATPELRKLAECTETMVRAYQRGEFAACLAAIDELEQWRGASKLNTLYRKLANDNLSNPPKEFDGQVVLDSK